MLYSSAWPITGVAYKKAIDISFYLFLSLYQSFVPILLYLLVFFGSDIIFSKYHLL